MAVKMMTNKFQLAALISLLRRNTRFLIIICLCLSVASYFLLSGRRSPKQGGPPIPWPPSCTSSASLDNVDAPCACVGDPSTGLESALCLSHFLSSASIALLEQAKIEHLVVSGVTSYPFAKYRHFVASFQQHVTSQSSLLLLFSSGDRPADFPSQPLSRVLYIPLQCSSSLFMQRLCGLPTVVLRNFFLEALVRHLSSLRSILSVDSRDLFFQSDPFPFIPPGLLTVTQESVTANTVGENPCMPQWIENCFPPGTLETYGHLPTINGGVFAASRKEMTRFLAAFRLEFILYASNFCLYNFGDQPVMNIMLYSGHAPGLRLHVQSTESGLFFTGQDSDKRKWWHYDESQRLLLNAFFSPYLVVHQWDRLPKELVAVLEQELAQVPLQFSNQ